MAGVEVVPGSDAEGDPKLPIITVVFRSFLQEFRLTQEFLGKLISNSSLDDGKF